jgi:hypothetical protein
MAGAGKKTFTAGETLTASDVNTYLMEQSVMVFGGTAARSSAVPTPSEGMTSYLKDAERIEAYDSDGWRPKTLFSVSANSLSATGSATITFPAGRFTESPLILVGVLSAAGASGTSATFAAQSTSGFTVYVWTGATLSTTARTVHWQAIQMTASASGG